MMGDNFGDFASAELKPVLIRFQYIHHFLKSKGIGLVFEMPLKIEVVDHNEHCCSGRVAVYIFHAPMSMENHGNGGHLLGISVKSMAKRTLGGRLFTAVLRWKETWRSPTEVRLQ